MFSIAVKLSVAVTAAAVLFAPVAGADDPDDCNQLPPDQVQQCQQRKDAKTAQDILNNANRGNGQQQQPADQRDRNKPLTGGGLMYVNGVLTCVPNGAVFRNNERVESYLPPNGDPRC